MFHCQHELEIFFVQCTGAGCAGYSGEAEDEHSPSSSQRPTSKFKVRCSAFEAPHSPAKVFDRNSQVCFRKPMIGEGLVNVTRARA